MPSQGKADGALRTISEVAELVGLPQHILRYWETRFSQLRPLQRAGNRRYYRAEDVALVQQIDKLLNRDGYTIAGVQKLLSSRARSKAEPVSPDVTKPDRKTNLLTELKAMRDDLSRALKDGSE
jgi:DNA-binding transcriptional MerR regulator